MDLGKQTLFAALSARMDWLGDRQRVLAQNVANANTPDYNPRDLKPLSFKAHLASGVSAHVGLAATDPAHRPGRSDAGAHGERRTGEAHVTTLTGNAVEMESELQKIAETSMDYQMMSNLYSKHLGMLKTALGRGGS